MSISSASLVPQATPGPDGYFPSPYSSDPLPGGLRTTLLPVAIMALVSAVSTFGLICFITYRMVFWLKYYGVYPGYNQYLLLIFNLVIADFQQSLAFLITWHWIAQNNILAPTAACFIQGWLVQVGDVSSGIWVLAIALHTWYSVVRRQQLPHRVFCSALVGIWAFVLLLATIGPIVHRKTYFVNTGAWCWINPDYSKYRLGLHYFWILLAQFGSVLIYGSIFYILRRTIQQVPRSSRSGGTAYINRAARYMVMYPVVYVVFSLPLPAGRLAVWNGAKVSLIFYCVGATLMTSCGFIDTILYTFTRQMFVTETSETFSNLDSTTNERNRAASIALTPEDQVANIGRNSNKKQGLDPLGSMEATWNTVENCTFENRSESGRQESDST
ncbi:hypothetical protein OIDMADRAFT_160730 [Oidiodendron maius Zn]|uniref:G-protein coupled receptors family 2 profile 2 domain-containing protein n=1 Tax=Oidiodendron maius (strain Zn) TaxID=913774 RepID=A0A0C3HJC8_OIDMZ|nr:hypothetical protein OIDMADRAFT_160730 [Oidiodendron maius Zn]